VQIVRLAEQHSLLVVNLDGYNDGHLSPVYFMLRLYLQCALLRMSRNPLLYIRPIEPDGPPDPNVRENTALAFRLDPPSRNLKMCSKLFDCPKFISFLHSYIQYNIRVIRYAR
jgi:hypothetical protein